MSPHEQLKSRQTDKAAIAEVILRERLSRDSGLFDEMASYYHPDSHIEVSWFKGNGLEFVRGSREHAEAKARRESASYCLS